MCALKELKKRNALRVRGEEPQEWLALFRTGEGIDCLEDCCPHAGAPLSEGEIEGECVVCPWHGSLIDLRTGAALTPPARGSVRHYPVAVRRGVIFLLEAEAENPL